jgi:hypothetical protein
MSNVGSASFVMYELEKEHREAMKLRLAKFPPVNVGDAVEIKVGVRVLFACCVSHCMCMFHSLTETYRAHLYS